MDRHICRAKRKDNGEWIYGYPARLDYMTNELFFIGPEFITHLVNQNTICKYIGKIDKNDEPIFEGDICKVNIPTFQNEDGSWDYIPMVAQCKFEKFTVSFICENEFGDTYRWYCGDDFSDEKDDCVEIIGNIYDNPELLET